jgi:uncharacterized protein (DUF952 family)
MTPLFHITSASEAAAAQETGEYRPKAFSREGFVHCSYRGQILGVANRLFRGHTDLVLLDYEIAVLSASARAAERMHRLPRNT